MSAAQPIPERIYLYPDWRNTGDHFTPKRTSENDLEYILASTAEREMQELRVATLRALSAHAIGAPEMLRDAMQALAQLLSKNTKEAK